MRHTTNKYNIFYYNNTVFYYDKINKKILNYIPDNAEIKIEKKTLSENSLFIFYPGKYFKPKKFPIIFHILALCSLYFSFIFIIVFSIFKINHMYFIYSKQWIIELSTIPIILFISLISHELGHFLSGMTTSGYVAEIGIKRKLLSPFYTITFFLSNKHKWIYYLGGININILYFIIGMLFFIRYYLPFLFYIAIINIILVIINFVPIKKLRNDGYKIFFNDKD